MRSSRLAAIVLVHPAGEPLFRSTSKRTDPRNPLSAVFKETANLAIFGRRKIEECMTAYSPKFFPK
jgi:hypothetical protein